MTTETKKVIACLGSGEGKPGDPMYDTMVEVGRLLAERGHTVATGGFGGIGMEAPCRGARMVGGHTIGYTFNGKPANEFVVDVVECVQDPVELQYGGRLGNLLGADAFIVATTGDLGTMVEFLAILNLSVKVWKEPKRVALLVDTLARSRESSVLDDLIFQCEAIPTKQKIFHFFRFFRTPAETVAWATGETPLAQP